MSKEFNSMAFTPDEKELCLKLVNYLFEYNAKSEDGFQDIHIWYDSYCTVVEWTYCPYHDDCGSFKYVGENEYVGVYPDHDPDDEPGDVAPDATITQITAQGPDEA